MTVVNNHGEEEWFVEAILCAKWQKRGRGKRRLALVKWQGFAEPTWEPVEEFKETLALDEFEKQYGPFDKNDGPLEAYEDGTRRAGRK